MGLREHISKKECLQISRGCYTNLTWAVCPKTVARKRGVQPSFSRRGFTSAPALPDEDDHHGDDDEEGVEQEKEENSSDHYWMIAPELEFRWGSD